MSLFVMVKDLPVIYVFIIEYLTLGDFFLSIFFSDVKIFVVIFALFSEKSQYYFYRINFYVTL